MSLEVLLKSLRKVLKKFCYDLRYIGHIPSNIINHNSINHTNHIAEGVSMKLCSFGKYNYIARRCSFYKVKVGSYCCFGPDLHVGGMQHAYWDYSMSPLLTDKGIVNETVIGNDVWIGAGCIIKQGTTIGDGAVIGANSFVNKDVEPYSIVVGSPARFVRFRFDQATINKVRESEYWNKKPSEAKQILSKI